MDLPKACLMLLGAALVIAASPQGVSGRATDIGVNGRANANASLAATGQFVALVWVARTNEGVTDIYGASSRDGGRTFGPPTRVNREAGEASVSGEQPPRIALVPRRASDPSIVVVWTAKSAGGTRLLSSRSDDGGRSFASSVPVPGSDASGNRGWEAIATNRDGHVVALWLDHRELAAGKTGATPMNHAEHDHVASDKPQTDGVARAQLSKLFFGQLDDRDSARALTGGVCYCCKTAIAVGGNGSVFAAWRHVYDGNLRDIAFTMSANGGRTFIPPVRVSEDHWAIDGCPENGPALTVDAANRIHVVWPTLSAGAAAGSEPTLALFYAMSEDGRRFAPRQQIPTDGVPRHPQIAMSPGGSLVVAWDEQINGSRRVVMSKTVPVNQGPARFTRVPVGITDRGEYPVVAAADDGYLIAWTSGPPTQSVIRVERMTTRE
jgi:hypothetical protein